MTNSRSVKLNARPGPIALETAKTAIVVVDMQNDFGSEGGLFDHAGIDISKIREVIGPISKVLSLARSAGIKVIYLKMGFLPDLSDLGTADSPNRIRHLHFGVGEKILRPDGRESRMLIRDTWNTDIVLELAPKPEDIVLYKKEERIAYITLHRPEQLNAINEDMPKAISEKVACENAALRSTES